MNTTINSADVEVVVVVVNFKSWRDAYLFLKNYGNFTCLNCKSSSHNLDVEIEHSDSEYAMLFCSKTISMVRLDFQFCCREWEHEKTGETLKDLLEKGCDYSWDLSDEVIDKIEDGNLWSFEEIEEVVKEYAS